jgi:acyl-homoserine-lactone acylase
MTLRHFAAAAPLLAGLLAVGCGRDPAATVAPAGARYEVEVRRTALGIPHIRANDFASLGYGYGYAHAEDNLCVLQEDLITIRGERAKYFGRAGEHFIVPNASRADNVSSDFFWKFMATDAAWQRLKAVADPALAQVTQGFVDGYNRYIAELRAGGHNGRHAACRDEAWLTPITEADMYRRYYRLALIASSSVFVDAIAELQPPTGGSGGSAAAPTPAQLRDSELAFFLPENRDKFGSNMYALGKDAVAAGQQSMVFGNPHFPWSGPERLYISHLTVPGQMDIMGASLYGVPAVLIGFTDAFAWSHTVSTAYRFTIYELTLVPGNPTQYVYDGQVRDMTAVPLSVEVKGEAEPERRTLYRSHYGPMMTITTGGQRILPWTTEKAYTMRDVNAENDRLLNQFARWNQAKSLDEFVSLHKTVLGIPWVNTVASGPDGPAYYGDISVVPHVTNAKLQSCAAQPVHNAVQAVAAGLPVLDGSRSACEWGDDTANPDADGVTAPAKGMFGPANLPKLERDDWVHNCNDSYWLSNPQQELTGYAGIIGAYNGLQPGAERYARTLRTRLCIQHVLRHLGQPGADTRGEHFDADGDSRFTLKELQDTVLSSQIYSAQLARDDVVARICPAGAVATREGPVVVSQACGVLGRWSKASNLDDVGSHIWREFFRLASPNPAGVGPNPQLWLTPFSASDPVNTPRDLNTGSALVQEALGRAVRQVENAGIAMDAPLGSLQRSGVIGDTVVPVFGGTGTEGAFTIVSVNNLDAGGYRITYGNSYIQTVTWARDGAGFTPVAEGFVTYSQSTDPASPHYLDFTREYSAKRWHRFPFKEADVAAQTVDVKLLSE